MKLPKRVMPKTSVNTDAKRKREQAAAHRREMAKWAVSWSDQPKTQDHLPGTNEDRFGQVYRKGGPRAGVDMPNDDRYGRGFASVENR